MANVQGSDVMVTAQTGSGKTAAFLAAQMHGESRELMELVAEDCIGKLGKRRELDLTSGDLPWLWKMVHSRR